MVVITSVGLEKLNWLLLAVQLPVEAVGVTTTEASLVSPHTFRFVVASMVISSTKTVSEAVHDPPELALTMYSPASVINKVRLFSPTIKLPFLVHDHAKEGEPEVFPASNVIVSLIQMRKSCGRFALGTGKKLMSTKSETLHSGSVKTNV